MARKPFVLAILAVLLLGSVSHACERCGLFGRRCRFFRTQTVNDFQRVEVVPDFYYQVQDYRDQSPYVSPQSVDAILNSDSEIQRLYDGLRVRRDGDLPPTQQPATSEITKLAQRYNCNGCHQKQGVDFRVSDNLTRAERALVHWSVSTEYMPKGAVKLQPTEVGAIADWVKGITP